MRFFAGKLLVQIFVYGSKGASQGVSLHASMLMSLIRFIHVCSEGFRTSLKAREDAQAAPSFEEAQRKAG